MTALNFPPNPVDGEIFGNYRYDDAIGVWRLLPEVVPALSALTDTEITAPQMGDSLVYDGSDWVNAPKSGNAIINGDFGVWQRGTSFSGATAEYTADRWQKRFSLNSTLARQAFTPADIEAIGYGDAEFFARFTMNAADTPSFDQYIEDVRTFAGQKVTLSFWAKADSGFSPTAQIRQNFGSGGSSEVTVATQTIALTTAWQRFSLVFDLPSLSGKTIGSNSFLNVKPLRVVDGLAHVVDIWGVQLEAGPVATPFKLAGGGSKGAELALCQRYYYRTSPTGTGQRGGNGFIISTTLATVLTPFPVTMRIRPLALEQSGTATDYSVSTPFANVSCSTVPIWADATPDVAQTTLTVASGLTAGQPCMFRTGSASGFLAWSAEL